MRRRTALSLFSFLSLSSPVATEPLPPGGGFSLPVMCALGRDCWTLNYPDMAEDSRVLDPACGARSYDGHKGTDFAIRDTVAMRRGVNVIASASGTVLRVRDGVADRRLRTANDRSRVAGRECGNGLVIDHGSGWETQYCHLRRRSVVVRPGQTVRRGQQLGKVGLSGRTEFPHVHLSIRHDGRVLDPATGRSVGSGCREKGRSLWKDAGAQAYAPFALYAVGFRSAGPSGDDIKADASSPKRLSADAAALVLWAAAFGVRNGDRLSLRIVSPGGTVFFKHTVLLEKNQAWRMEFSGRNRPEKGLAPGVWRGTATLNRRRESIRRSVSVEIE